MANDKDIEVLRAKFLRVFAGVSINLRDEIIAIVDDESVNWSSAYVEVMGKTTKGDQIIRRMDELGLLGD